MMSHNVTYNVENENIIFYELSYEKKEMQSN